MLYHSTIRFGSTQAQSTRSKCSELISMDHPGNASRLLLWKAERESFQNFAMGVTPPIISRQPRPRQQRSVVPPNQEP